MQFLSWDDMAVSDKTSVSTQKRLQKTDPRYPRKVHLSPGRVGFPSSDKEAYDRARIDDPEWRSAEALAADAEDKEAEAAEAKDTAEGEDPDAEDAEEAEK